MGHKQHEPKRKTREHGKEAYESSRKTFITILVILIAIIITSIYSLLTQSDLVPVLIYSVPLIVILIISALTLRPNEELKKLPTHHYELDQSGIHQSVTDPETEEVNKIDVPFSTINRVLIGNFVLKRESIGRFSATHYEYWAIMSIEHDDGVYMHLFQHMDEFEDWLPRFLNQDFPVVKTEYNLAPAFQRLEGEDFNFYDVPGEPWGSDTQPPPIGKITLRNRFKPWKLSSTYQSPSEKAAEKKKKRQRTETKKWEKQALMTLALMSFIVIGIIFPVLPHEDGVIIRTTMVNLIMVVVALPPIVSVFWRPHTSWYLPVLCFVVPTIVGLGIYGLETLFLDLPYPYVRVLQFFGTLSLFGWVPGYIIIRFVRGFID